VPRPRDNGDAFEERAWQEGWQHKGGCRHVASHHCSPLSSGDCPKEQRAEGTECQELVEENLCPCFAFPSLS